MSGNQSRGEAITEPIELPKRTHEEADPRKLKSFRDDPRVKKAKANLKEATRRNGGEPPKDALRYYDKIADTVRKELKL